jgi:hypothetical protein
MTTLWYFSIEPVKSRYTEQLCNVWMPNAFASVIKFRQNMQVKTIEGETTQDDIKWGSVLDATGRGIYSLTQVSNFLKALDNGAVANGDKLFFQDFWTPGIEAIFYAASLMHVRLEIYSMCHAQTFDKYDFTYPMKYWMRPIELSYANEQAGIFVASSIHKELLKVAGVNVPIHVVSLPIDYYSVRNRIHEDKRDMVTFVSRLDREKQPEFMLEVAMKFLEKHTNWIWYITTSSKQFRSDVPRFIQKLFDASQKQSRLFLTCGLTKAEYYLTLGNSKINFNSSLQDFVSWTLLEACIAGCDLVYPNFRSFVECVPQDRLYKAFDVESALHLFDEVIKQPQRHYSIARQANYGRMKEADIIINGADHEYNIYEETKYEHDISE